MQTDPGDLTLRVRLSRPSPEADCMDCLVAMSVAVDRLRAGSIDVTAVEALVAHTQAAFRKLDEGDNGRLLLVAAAADDCLYRFVAQLTVLDAHTRFYISMAIGSFYAQLSQRKVRTFYVLDNALRDDRLEAVLELFELAGIAAVTPRRDGLDWTELADGIQGRLSVTGHVAYIEPDAQVNHIASALELGRRSGTVATFRNQPPDDPNYQILALSRLKATGGR